MVENVVIKNNSKRKKLLRVRDKKLGGAMPLLQVRNCPSNLYESITQVAKKENRSIAQQTIVLLEQSFQIGRAHV